MALDPNDREVLLSKKSWQSTGETAFLDSSPSARAEQQEPELLTVEPVCGTWTFKNGTMRNLAEPGPRFWAAAPNHPKALLEEPQAFQAVGEKPDQPSYTINSNCFAKDDANQIFRTLCSCWNSNQIPWFQRFLLQ